MLELSSEHFDIKTKSLQVTLPLQGNAVENTLVLDSAFEKQNADNSKLFKA